MSDVVWLNQGDTAVINGWYFHFRDMYALRSEWSSSGRNRMELILKFKDRDIISWYTSDYRLGYSEDVLREIVGHKERRWNGLGYDETWYAFFTQPEDRFNQVVQDAYETYLFEKAIRG